MHPANPTNLYLDAAATEPVTRNVIEAMMPFMTDAIREPGKRASTRQDGGEGRLMPPAPRSPPVSALARTT